MTKKELLYELNNETYVTLKSSPVHGIGVYAICDIPKGSRNIFSRSPIEWIKVSFQEVEQMPKHSREFIETYYLYDDIGYFIPEYGCKVMDLVSYLNHSYNPNILSDNDGEYFEAIRDIIP